MKTKVLILAICALACGSAAQAQIGGFPENKGHEADRAEIERLDRLVSTTENAEEGLSVYAPNTVADDFFPPHHEGIAEIRKDFQIYMDNYENFHAEVKKMEVDTDGVIGVAVSYQHFTAKGKNGTPDLNADIRQTDVYHKVDGRWAITYQQLSVPIDLKTGKAVWNSGPGK